MANGFDPRATASPQTAGTAGRESVAFDAGLRSHMLSVYNYMASGVLLTGIVALLFAAVRRRRRRSSSAPASSNMSIMFSPLALVMVLSFGINRMSTGEAQALLLGVRDA